MKRKSLTGMRLPIRLADSWQWNAGKVKGRKYSYHSLPNITVICVRAQLSNG